MILSVLICTRHPCHLNRISFSPVQSKEFSIKKGVQSIKSFFFFFLFCSHSLPRWTSRTVLSPLELLLTQSHRKQYESRQSNRDIIKTLNLFTFYFSKIPSTLARSCFAWNQPGLHSDYQSQRISKRLFLWKRASLQSVCTCRICLTSFIYHPMSLFKYLIHHQHLIFHLFIYICF